MTKAAAEKKEHATKNRGWGGGGNIQEHQIKKKCDKGNRNNKTMVKQHEQTKVKVIKHPYGKQCHSATAN